MYSFAQSGASPGSGEDEENESKQKKHPEGCLFFIHFMELVSAIVLC